MQYPPSPLKAIFFDLDNVLVFSEIMHYKAWQIVVEQVGGDPNHLDFHRMMGISDVKQAELMVEELALPCTAEQLWLNKREVYIQIIQNGFEHPQGRNELLQHLSQFYQIGVVSSNNRRVIEETLEIEKIRHLFKFIIGYEDSEQHKPDPGPYLKALEITQVAAHEALVVEDSLYGIKAAQNAAIPVIGIVKDQRPDDLLKDIRYFGCFNELSSWMSSPKQS